MICAVPEYVFPVRLPLIFRGKDFSVDNKTVLRYELILASASPRRRELLSSMGLEYRILTSDCEELSQEKDPLLSGEKIALENALRKARSIAQKNRTSLVLGADTVVVCDNLVFGKPGSETEAFSMLKALSGREHSVITGVALCCEKDSICEQFKVTTKVRFKSLDDEAIRSYMQCVPVMDKAGAYAIQDHGDMLLEKISGSFSNVIGLPVEELSCRLEKYS